jgi:hypothetical protein
MQVTIDHEVRQAISGSTYSTSTVSVRSVTVTCQVMSLTTALDYHAESLNSSWTLSNATTLHASSLSSISSALKASLPDAQIFMSAYATKGVATKIDAGIVEP